MISFEDFMYLALYGPEGFYIKVGSSGRRLGDFLTSPEVGPLFACVIARYLDATWLEMGCPSEFDVVEVGAGMGTLARGIFDAKPKCMNSIKYRAIELSEYQRARHPNFVESASEFADEKVSGVILANELLDNLPFRLFIYDGIWKEVYIEKNGSGDFYEVFVDIRDIPQILPNSARVGSRAPIIEAASNWVNEASKRLEKGRLLIFDYCTLTTEEIVNTPWMQWLRTFRKHERGTHYLISPGSQDITTQVVIDQIAAQVPHLSTTTQIAWLRKWGIDDLVSTGTQFWEANRHNPNVYSLKMRSRQIESDALMDVDGLGGFSVLELQKNLDQ